MFTDRHWQWIRIGFVFVLCGLVPNCLAQSPRLDSLKEKSSLNCQGSGCGVFQRNDRPSLDPTLASTGLSIEPPRADFSWMRAEQQTFNITIDPPTDRTAQLNLKIKSPFFPDLSFSSQMMIDSLARTVPTGTHSVAFTVFSGGAITYGETELEIRITSLWQDTTDSFFALLPITYGNRDDERPSKSSTPSRGTIVAAVFGSIGGLCFCFVCMIIFHQQYKKNGCAICGNFCRACSSVALGRLLGWIFCILPMYHVYKACSDFCRRQRARRPHRPAPAAASTQPQRPAPVTAEAKTPAHIELPSKHAPPFVDRPPGPNGSLDSSPYTPTANPEFSGPTHPHYVRPATEHHYGPQIPQPAWGSGPGAGYYGPGVSHPGLGVHHPGYAYGHGGPGPYGPPQMDGPPPYAAHAPPAYEDAPPAYDRVVSGSKAAPELPSFNADDDAPPPF